MGKVRGLVYILTNKSFRDDWVKIGKSLLPLYEFGPELNCKEVPLPYDIFVTLQTEKYLEIEEQLRKQLDAISLHHSKLNNDFYEVSREFIVDKMIELSSNCGDAEVILYEDGEPRIIYPFFTKTYL